MKNHLKVMKFLSGAALVAFGGLMLYCICFSIEIMPQITSVFVVLTFLYGALYGHINRWFNEVWNKIEKP